MTKSEPTEEEQAEILRAKDTCVSDDKSIWFDMDDFQNYFRWFSEEVTIKNNRLCELLGVGKTFIYNAGNGYSKISQKQLVIFARLLQLSDKEKIRLYEQVGGLTHEYE